MTRRCRNAGDVIDVNIMEVSEYKVVVDRIQNRSVNYSVRMAGKQFSGTDSSAIVHLPQ